MTSDVKKRLAQLQTGNPHARCSSPAHLQTLKPPGKPRSFFKRYKNWLWSAWRVYAVNPAALLMDVNFASIWKSATDRQFMMCPHRRDFAGAG